MMSLIKFFILILLVSSNVIGKEKQEIEKLPTKLKIKSAKMLIPKIETKADINLKTKELKLRKIDLDHHKLAEKLKIEKKMTAASPKIVSHGYTVGSFKKLEWGDKLHLKILANGHEHWFWCSKGCEKIEELQNETKEHNILVIWQEIHDTRIDVKAKETLAVAIPTKTSKGFHSCTKFKSLPQNLEGCEGEACGYLRYEKSLKSVSVFKEPDSNSRTVDFLKRCEKISDFKSYTTLKDYGWLKVEMPNSKLESLGVKKGDFVPLVKSLGEGFGETCIGNEFHDVVDTLVSSDAPDNSSVKYITFPNSEGWVQLKTPRGKIGYVAEKENFYMGYYDYEPSKFCPEDHPCGPEFNNDLRLAVSEHLPKIFKQVCAKNFDCEKNDPTTVCPRTTKLWQKFSKHIPSSVQCAGFGVSETACKSNWRGSFSCSCKKGNDEFNPYYSYNCTEGGNEIQCRIN